ncbi:PREDICTED: uncharacterized protein LOC107194135 [Dufourea novaeangliae]|uniref:Ribosomal protein mS38 C-terminal domain-containing protein n=1 Tax=Dufourea novaeangliae TaxID=178035 RepID=A0A154P3B9_DUFNO|nr:PREDICTED: uncharacterized protein LOC107194135 [Dufourea novaeangliae]KZC05844.1 hypothetical protein WN55_04784 [Dufourea novaeangliae]
MALNRLCAVFQQATISRQCNVIARCYSSYFSREQSNTLPTYLPKDAIPVINPKLNIKFVSRTLNLDFGNLDNTTNKNIIEIPFKNIPSLEDPLVRRPVKHDLPLVDKSIDLPSVENVFEKLAIRLIVIRRQKMKKHKRKKFRKRMKFVFAKLRQKRNLKKERLFQAQLIEKIEAAKAFNAKEYVAEKLKFLNAERIPKTYRGEILPPEMIKKFLEAERQKKERKKNKFRLTLD